MLKSLLLVTLLSTAGLVYAEHDSSYHDGVNRPSTVNQNLSRRPYSAPVEKSDVIEGNTATEDSEKQARHQKTLNLHMLGKRPYAEKNTD